MRTLVTGATGLIGRALIKQLGDVVVLSRDAERARLHLPSVEAHAWRPESEPAPSAALRSADVIFNLAGEPLAEGRWSAGKKARIRDSRVQGTRNLVAGLAALGPGQRPRVLVSASAVGYYGDREDEVLDEGSLVGHGFLAEVCAAWEREAMAAERLDIRVVCVRIGLVLARGGGALGRMLIPFKMGVGGRLGGGRQWMSWITIEDAVGILLHASGNDQIRGAMNAVAPQPVTNAEFTQALGRAVHRPAVLLPVPKAVLRVAFGEMSELLLASQRVFPRIAHSTGYTFRHPELARALDAIVS
jgi:uncharacterized protein (TIGR01777 family)